MAKMVLAVWMTFCALWLLQSPAEQTAPLAVSAIAHQVNLTWTAPTSGVVSGFYLYKAGYRKNNWKKIGTLTPLSVSYVDANVSAGQSYQYRMQTYCTSCSVQNSKYSNTVFIQVP